jgi:hypothetical protein
VDLLEECHIRQCGLWIGWKSVTLESVDLLEECHIRQCGFVRRVSVTLESVDWL